MTCCWPTKSSSVCGRSRCASGACRARSRPAVSSKRSDIDAQYARGVRDEVSHGRIAAVLEPIHRQLVDRLAPQQGERWLDLTHGSPTIATDAREHGADVMVFDGNPEYLPCDDGEFDAVASAFGFIWAPDHANVATELGRVSQPGARLGFTAW